jgi:hypothetical protein
VRSGWRTPAIEAVETKEIPRSDAQS